MYSIILTDGKIVNIKANEVEWYEKSQWQWIRFIYEKQVVAMINMDNVAGWINIDNKVKSEDKKYD